MTHYTVICEGKSEEDYLNQLNLFLKENDINVSFVIKNALSGNFDVLKSNYLRLKELQNIIIWADFDIYKNNVDGNMEKYKNKPCDMPDFHFSYNNFEDFLIMHLDKPYVLKLQEMFETKNHFNKPLNAYYYKKIMPQILLQYKKGHVPYKRFFNKQAFQNLVSNQLDNEIKFKSDFVSIIQKALENFL